MLKRNHGTRVRSHFRGTVACWVLAAAFVPAQVRGQTAQFSDQTDAAGVTCTHTTMILDPALKMTAGGAVGDFNNDGWQDLFVLGGYGAPDRLFINNRNGTFDESAAAWGIARVHRGVAVAVGDYNSDGWLDLYVTVDPGEDLETNRLYRNNGNGTFTDVAPAAGVAYAPGKTVGGGFGAAFGDYDLDGRLDLAVADWYGDWYTAPGANRLYHNNGNGTFTNVTTATLPLAVRNSHGFSPRFADMNGDRYPELLWTADFQTSRYLINNGNGTFTDWTANSGTGLDGNGMGTSVLDVNGDGRPDWFVTSIYSPTYLPGTGNMLYINQGANVFSESSAAWGVKNGGWGWGSVNADFNHDGSEDLAHANGWTSSEFNTNQTRVYINNGSSVFQQVAPACGVGTFGSGRGMAAMDYNNDGAMDVVLFSCGAPLKLYRNDLAQGPGTAWLRVFLDARSTKAVAPNGYGAHVTVTTGGPGGGVRHRWINGGSNYISQSELSAHFGLGSAPVVGELRVVWPNGHVTIKQNVPVNQTLTLVYCNADFNGNGTATVQDIFDFLAAWFAGQPSANINGVGGVTVQDIFDFLAAWFAGCP